MSAGQSSSGSKGGKKAASPGGGLLSEWPNALLLVILYMIQGVPLGLSMGSMPFLMRNNMSYTKIGIFTLAGYPYSFKLLWSPIVDTLYMKKIGQRKSWILPLQLMSAYIMIKHSGWVESMLFGGDAVKVTAYFFVLVLLAATQDIAVDGWALTLLSKKNVGYAATCQTIGMNIGYFSSFTIFLALNDPSFCSKYLGTNPDKAVVSLREYLELWGWIYLIVTVAVALFKKETMVHEDETAPPIDKEPQEAEDGPRRSQRISRARRKLSNVENGIDVDALQETPSKKYRGIINAYAQLWRTIRLPPVKLLSLVLIIARLGMLPAESAAPLKLLEKGVSKEALAGLVLIEFPIELLSALVAGQWAASSHPLRPWLVGYKIRLAVAAATTICVAFFPVGVSNISGAPLAFGVLVILGLMTSFSSTLMFTALGDFYNRISDPTMGGAYLTMLNTIANIGVVVPKVAVFALIDLATVKNCPNADASTCTTIRDGFYTVSFGACIFGLALLFWLKRVLVQLETYPIHAWRSSSTDKLL
jgi:PAT family acetyl-CoA transporter-like MFS transporter 1